MHCLEGRLNPGHFRYGKVERVKKIKDYAFVHFEERDQAVDGEGFICKFEANKLMRMS